MEMILSAINNWSSDRTSFEEKSELMKSFNTNKNKDIF